MATFNELKKLEDNDFQNRHGGVFRCYDRPDSIEVWDNKDGTAEIKACFKNYNEDGAKRWIERFVSAHGFEIVMSWGQQGDDCEWTNDWVDGVAIVKIS